MNVDGAFEEFRSQALKVAGREPDKCQSTEPGERKISSLSKGDAGLRLVWDRQAHTVTLEISHGPPDGPTVGWFDLYRVSETGAHLSVDTESAPLSSAITYGLELLFP